MDARRLLSQHVCQHTEKVILSQSVLPIRYFNQLNVYLKCNSEPAEADSLELESR